MTIWIGSILLAATSVWSWLTAAIVAPIAVGALMMLRRSALGRRWRSRAEHDRREWAACELRGTLMSKMTAAQRIELQSLEELVDHLRTQTAAMTRSQELADAKVVARLDGLVALYVDLSIELEETIAAFATTADDLPGYVEPGTTLEINPRSTTYVRITELRVQAREQCRRRIGRLRSDLRGIGQVVRLVHEQALAAGLSGDEVARQLGDILDEAERVREAGEEADALTAAIGSRNDFAVRTGDTQTMLPAAS